jgi:hypothetical protein
MRGLALGILDSALYQLPPHNPHNPPTAKPPLILNMADAAHAGGGFRYRALAQKEALCYRTSLIFTRKNAPLCAPRTCGGVLAEIAGL